MQWSCFHWIWLWVVLESGLLKLLSELWKLHRRLTEESAHFRKGAPVVTGKGFELGEVAWQQ